MPQGWGLASRKPRLLHGASSVSFLLEVGVDVAVAREVGQARWGGLGGGMLVSTLLVSTLLPLKLTFDGNFVALEPAIVKPEA